MVWSTDPSVVEPYENCKGQYFTEHFFVLKLKPTQYFVQMKRNLFFFFRFEQRKVSFFWTGVGSLSNY